eukprot:m.67360 g.67360  ORF g.67360 m.67360 type:complete len:104 (-) comp12161_c0_seq1:52-363(-)
MPLISCSSARTPTLINARGSIAFTRRSLLYYLLVDVALYVHSKFFEHCLSLVTKHHVTSPTYPVLLPYTHLPQCNSCVSARLVVAVVFVSMLFFEFILFFICI